jgi:hypothetical protein
MRYFKTTNASRQYKTGGLVFTFEPVANVGGSWLGVLAVGEPAASTLAAAGIPQVSEITSSEYEEAKKKSEEGSQFLRTLAAQQPAVSSAPGSNCRSCGTHPYSATSRRR